MTIKARLITSHSVLTIIAVLILAIPTILIQANKLVSNTSEITSLRVENVNKDIENFLQTSQSSVDAVARFLKTQGSGVTREVAEAYLESEASGNDAFSMLYITSANGVCDGGFVYTNIGWRAPDDFDQTTRSWYKDAVSARGQFAFSDPYVDAQSGDVVVTVSKAVYSGSTVIGCAAVDLSLAKVVQNIEKITLTKSGSSFVINSKGYYVTNPDASKIGADNFYREYGFDNESNYINSDETYINPKSGGRYFVARNLSGVTGWTIVSFGPQREFFFDITDSILRMIVFGIAVVIIALISSYVIAVRITKPLITVGKALTDISSGHADLTRRLDYHGKNEIGVIAGGFNSFMEKLQDIVTKLKKSNDMLVTTGDTLANSAEGTASAIFQIIENIETVDGHISAQNDSVSETAGAVNQIASNIQSLERMIESQASGVTEASAAVEQMIGNISSVNGSVEKMALSFDSLQVDAETGTVKQKNVNEQIAEIETQSKMLQEANAAISSIASQTNLLAMNAAIEAAHAGEAGRGFSVVADEIRKLSETSSAQSKTIGLQLKKIQSSIKEVVVASGESTTAINSVSQKISETDQLVRQIKSAMEEQQEGSKQVIESLKQL